MKAKEFNSHKSLNKSFYVGQKEIYEQLYSIEASSKEEAVSILKHYLETNEGNVKLLNDEFAFVEALDEFTTYDVKN